MKTFSWITTQLSQAGSAGGGGGGGGGTNQFDTDSGTATPVAGVITMAGGTNINTSGSGSTVTINLDNIVSLTHADNGSTQGYFQFNSINFMHNYGDDNTFVGENAGNNTLTPASSLGNTAIGALSGQSLTTGALNTLCGNGAGINVSSGNNNCAFGQGALGTATSSNSTALGFNALAAYAPASSDTGQVAVGFDCLQSVTTGTECTAIGAECGMNLTSANQCTLIGRQACDVSTTIGNANICIGYRAARSSTLGANNIILGNSSGTGYIASEANNILINNVGIAADANTIRIGTQGAGANQQNLCFVAGITGINVGSVADVVSIDTGTGQLGTTTLTAGSNITITPGAGTITIAASGGGGGLMPWTEVNSASQALAPDNGYYVTYMAGGITLTLPASCPAGSVIYVMNVSQFQAVSIIPGASQFIIDGAIISDGSVGGFVVLSPSVNFGNANGGSIQLLCTVADTTFYVINGRGNISYE